MKNRRDNILILDSLQVGFRKGKSRRSLLVPLSTIVKEGEMIAIIGQNGIGKSTLLRTLAGLQNPVGGQAVIDGKNIEDYGRYELAKSVAYISTEPVRVNNMTVTDLVRLGRYPHTGWTGGFSNEDRNTVSAAIQKTGIEHLAARYINELSDGERQRSMIARAISQDTGILLMDEPTAFLDVRSRYEIIHLLRDLSLIRGTTVIYSTHDLQIAIDESDRIWLLSGDRFAEGAPEDLILNNAIGRLFDESEIKFNASDASFRYPKRSVGTVSVEGEEPFRYWTTRAAGRNGFNLTETDPDIRIRVNLVDGQITWNTVCDENSNEFSSIYELAEWLRMITKNRQILK